MADDDQDANARIVDIQLDDKLVIRRSAKIEHEMGVAIFDLLDDNLFAPVDAVLGPYRVRLAIRDGRSLVFEISDNDGNGLTNEVVPLNLFRRIVKDYFTVCESYFDAIKNAPASRIEALDMGRRGLHNEGGVLLRDNLEGRITIDDETARRLFTLICVLHIRG